ncbi:MAG: phosphatidylglycerol lysyltransferase domain-containing protein [Proteobacteria bacterium]|nr:phosphatidylglycerol lysyltransferase domain-containing protein [Pseudomonadota bacterium]
MNIEPLNLSHKELLYDKLRNIDTMISEYSFANLYLFRKVHQYKVITDKEIFIEGVTYDGYKYLMPTKPIDKIDSDYLKEISKDYSFIFPVDEKWVENLINLKKDFREGDSDYIYLKEKIKTYPGKSLHNKKNLLNFFLREYKAESKALIAERMDDAKYILEEWQKESGQPKEETDYYSLTEAFDLYDELVICGIIYYVNNEPAGFVIGEERGLNMFLLHFAKGLTKYKGIYQYIFHSFAEVLPDRYTYLNFEQDLDKENLRISKQSYHPEFMVKKLRVSI